MRTLIVLVTLVGCSLGYSWNWVQQRRNALATGGVQVDEVDPFTGALISVVGPWRLRIFGERGYSNLNFVCSSKDFKLTPLEQQKVERLRRLFPEASINYCWIPPPQPLTSESTVKDQRRALDAYLKFPAEQDYQMPSGTMMGSGMTQ